MFATSIEKRFMMIVSRVMAFYTELDQQVARFQLETGLRCPVGCGECCLGTTLHTTVLEMLPAAKEILRQGEGDDWLARIASPPSGPRCVLYQTEHPEDTPGHCGFYTWRPAVCRLFGFAAVHTRSGNQILAACKTLKHADPATVATAMALSADAPCFSNVNAMLCALDPTSGSHLMPINEALQKAIHRMGLYLQMTQDERLGHVSVA
jgi:uncharacterized protein